MSDRDRFDSPNKSTVVICQEYWISPTNAKCHDLAIETLIRRLLALTIYFKNLGKK